MSERRSRWRRRVASLVAWLVVAPMSGCATDRESWLDPPDPLEPINRYFFGLNEVLGQVIGEPITGLYRLVTPEPVRGGVDNFFDNLAMPNAIVNDVLQGRLDHGLENLGRLAVNTTVGIGGILDPATEMGLEQPEQHFAATAGAWGLDPGPYLVLPVLGPTTLVGLPDIPIRILSNPVISLTPTPVQISAMSVGAVNEIETNREPMRRVREAVEPYSFMRSGFMQRMWSIIQRARSAGGGEGGEAPFEELPDDLLEDLDEAEPRGEGAPAGTPGGEPAGDAGGR